MNQTNAQGPQTVQDTPAEALPALSPEQVIDNAVKSFSETEVTDAKIAEIKKFTDTLSIAGVEDKAGYKKVDAARKKVKNYRLAVTNKEKELLELPKNFTAAVKGESKRLVDALKPIEDDLHVKQKAIDDVVAEQKRKAAEAAAAEARKIAFREKSLYDLGALRDGEGRFVVREWAVEPDQVKDLPEDEFTLLVQAIKQTEPKPQPAEAAPAPSEPLPADTTPTQAEAAPAATAAAPINIPTRRTPAAAATAAAPAQATTSAPQATPGPDLRFVAGFEAAKRAVIAILQSPDKMTRAELINRINNLKS